MKYLTQLFTLLPHISCNTSVSFNVKKAVHSRMSWIKRAGAEREAGRSLIHIQQRGSAAARVSIFLFICTLPIPAVQAGEISQYPKTDEEWQTLMARVSLLDNATLIPSLLPAILENRDALDLRENQLERMHRWKNKNYVRMVNIMNDLIDKRVRFRIKSLSPQVKDGELIALESDIQRQERRLLKIRLRCRDIVMETFTREQWETFEFVVADDPKLGSLIYREKQSLCGNPLSLH